MTSPTCSSLFVSKMSHPEVLFETEQNPRWYEPAEPMNAREQRSMREVIHQVDLMLENRLPVPPKVTIIGSRKGDREEQKEDLRGSIIRAHYRHAIYVQKRGFGFLSKKLAHIFSHQESKPILVHEYGHSIF